MSESFPPASRHRGLTLRGRSAVQLEELAAIQLARWWSSVDVVSSWEPHKDIGGHRTQRFPSDDKTDAIYRRTFLVAWAAQLAAEPPA